MSAVKVIAIFDVGKTNKKLLLLDKQYQLVYEESTQLDETTDEDGFACEDVQALTGWVKDSFDRLLNNKQFDIKAVNFSAYGASFVYLDKEGKVMLPLYNYLKPYPAALQKKFYTDYGEEDIVARQTASPVLGSLNSGMQLYRLKYEKPELFSKIKWAVHLPQYLSYILSSAINADITSVGCHTRLWDFECSKYHDWVYRENMAEKLPPIVPFNTIAGHYKGIPAGIGLHDSSAALIPYLASFRHPFILLSTGTWCISLNPFNQAPLTTTELGQDCLCYLSYEGKRVKASRLFAGYEHEQETKRLARHFNLPGDYYKSVVPDAAILKKLKPGEKNSGISVQPMAGPSAFGERDLSGFLNYEEAYHQLIVDIVTRQVEATNLVLEGTDVEKIFVDGGFSKNEIYMHLLAEAFPAIKVFASSVPQASAIGAAFAMHPHWNQRSPRAGIIELKAYNSAQVV